MRNQAAKNAKWKRIYLILIAAIGLCFGAGTQSQAAGLLIADGGFGGVLEIEEHSVDVTINNGIAVTRVTQVFRNTENRQVEALYTFPVPKGASVSNFSMWIGGKEMVGEVLEKQRAREIYNSYKQKRRDPGLLEQKDYKTFEMRIFPINAKASQKVEITYYQELDFDHDWATYVYPLATVAEGKIDSRTTGKFAVSVAVKSEIPIKSMESPSHGEQFVMVRRTDNFHEASLEMSQGSLARDVIIAYQAVRPHTGMDLITSNVSGEDGFFSLTLTAGKELESKESGMDYVFILDISGSMQNDGKLHASQNSADAFTRTLGSDDRFEIIAFNTAPYPLFSALSVVNDETLTASRNYLASQQARGGTVLRPALQTAYKYADPDRTLNIVLLSDGMTEVRERRELLALIRSRPSNVRVFCIGIGNEVNRPLLKQLAEDAGGLAAFISQGDNFERQAKAFRRKLMHPVATDIKISFAAVDVYELEPKVIPNLFYGMPVRIYGRYRGSGTARVRLEAMVHGRQIVTEGDLTMPGQDPDNPEIERMWAWHKIKALEASAERGGESDRITNEIVRLGEGFSIVTEHTSFLVLENDEEYKRWKIERRNATRIARDRKAQRKVRERLLALRDASTDALGPTAESKPAEKQLAMNNPIAQAPQIRTSAPRTNGPTSSRRRAWRGMDIPMGGGGAIDPLSFGLALTLTFAGLTAMRRRKGGQN